MNFIIISSQIISFIRSNSPQNNRASWLLWREYVEQIYEFDIDANKIKLFINQGKGSFKTVIKSENDFKTVLESLTEEEQTKTVELIKLFFVLEENEKEQLNISFHNKVWNSLTEILALSSENLLSLDNHITEWIEKHEDKRFFTPINIKASLIPINLDFFLRCILLWMYNAGNLEWSKVYFDSSVSFFLLGNLLLITLTVFLFALIRGKIIKNKTSKLFESLNIKRLKLTVKKSAWNYTLIFLYVIIGIFIFVSIEELATPLPGAVIIGVFQGIYLLIILNLFSKRTPQSRDVLTQLEEINAKNLDRELTHEENDEEIINLEVKLRSINEQMEAFVLEAALFGALAFSGFLSVIASDVFSIEIIESFSKNIGLLLKDIVSFDISNDAQILGQVLSREGLLALICYETLFCSIFFLSVIASRLRFNDLTDFIDRSLQISKSTNEREEELVSNSNITDGKVKKLSKKIRSHLRFGNLKYEEIGPIMEYMKFFRTLGISTFFVIIITGGLFISVELSIIMLFISILSLFYFRLNRFIWAIKSFNIRVQEFYFTKGKYVNWTSWALIILAFLLRSSSMPGANIIMLLGFSLLCLHHLFRLFIPDVIETKSVEFERGNSLLKMYKKIEKIGMAFFYLGFMFKAMHWPGASAMLVFSLLFLSGFYFFNPKNTGVKWMNLLFSITIGFWCLSVLFKFQHWPGNLQMEPIGIVGIIIAAIVTIIKRSEIPKTLKRTIFILAVLTISLQNNYTSYAITHMDLSYERYVENKQHWQLRYPLYAPIENGGYANPSSPEQKDSLQVSTKRYTEFLFNNSRYIHNISEEALDAYHWSEDEIVLNEAIIWIKADIESKGKYLQNMDRYLRLLMKLHRWQEAENIAQECLLLGKEEGRETEEVEEWLKEIREELAK
ncbi:MAG: hypothetical protein P8Q14_03460 [Vicingaceae bacterium]|nr:hypothetical protein [Vicingaceae bacterium]